MTTKTKASGNKVKAAKKAPRARAKKAPVKKAAPSKAKKARRPAAKASTSSRGKYLVIVESPAKARTLERYLGSEFNVLASVGHVIDLPVSSLGVDVDNDFAPQYETIKGKKAIVENLKRQARMAKRVYLAPDPDREGEAIAYHIAQAIGNGNTEIHRAVFHEVTKSAVLDAIENPRDINTNLFNAQQARRILDRLVGYKISPLLWKKVRRGLSAGRVQSVALRLICDREKEIRIFKPVEYWTVGGKASASSPPPFHLRLAKIDGKPAEVHNQAESDAIIDEVRGQPFVVSKVIKREAKKRPFAPFITSTLQQEAARKLRMTAQRTMRLAQRLYEGIEFGDSGPQGLITYMRTDSTRFSPTAVEMIRGYIREHYDGDYLPAKPRLYTNKKSAQDAHEAIRPTDVNLTPKKAASYLDKDSLALYTLIWNRAVACQVADAKMERTRIETPVGRYLFVATGSVVKFPGFLAIYEESRDEMGRSESDSEGAEPVQQEGDERLPSVSEGEKLSVEAIGGKQHFTQPPPRFTEAGLVKELEHQGIGRPSTYASIISTILDREYAIKENGAFKPEELGVIITDLLTESFPQIMDIKFTAMMEDQLDKVEEGKVDWVELLRNFYGPFAKRLESAEEKMRNLRTELVPTDFVCEKCDSAMVVRWGRNGKFLACSAYPACKNTKPIKFTDDGKVEIVEAEETNEVCPNCKRKMVVKTGRRGRFLSCSGYPECKTSRPLPIGIPCPRPGCEGEMVERQSGRGKTFYSCSAYPECRFSIWERPEKQRCETCGEDRFLMGKPPRQKVFGCAKEDCAYAPAYTPGQDSEKKKSTGYFSKKSKKSPKKKARRGVAKARAGGR